MAPLVAGEGDPLGTHRSLTPPGALPQPAQRVDNDFSRCFATELLVDVEVLNVDAASFRQMEEAGGGVDGVRRLVTETVAARGKQHNPVTGSGGMLLGRVAWVGTSAAGRGFSVGDRIATLASLSLTPLSLTRIGAVRPESAQLDVEGRAVVFASAPLAKLPADLPERVALAALDVAGAAPQIARRAAPGASVVVLGAGGKSGVLCAVEARRRVGPAGKVVGVESHGPYAQELRELGVCDAVASVDGRDALAVRAAVLDALGHEADLSVSCVNVPGVEMSAILATRDRGTAYFFAMSTSFGAAALGAEGVGKDIELAIGNGYAHGHAEHTLDLIRGHAGLRALFERRYG